ncbi:hypothetical protein BD309DRAFT_891949 [Dichomitus squalens]|uniref:Uncharacterized protein n=1 Tax=Dichomitus squalens TaxID=114155 RepID=A0A4Q9PP03_9APHY|nr:hypothetical protein BD309DRAFT_891949 [Dichomitus squalens]TBU56027.1 hypothetical protein BD310DRAFT_883273 [Dichomitus squalens]
MSPSNHHDRQTHHIPPPILARPSKCRTICDLPVELLDMIISHLESDAWGLWSCTFACSYFRAVSIERYFCKRLSAVDIRNFDHILSFLQANPRIAAKIRNLTLSGDTRRDEKGLSLLTTIDDTIVLRLVRLLPRLESLVLRTFIYGQPQQSIPPLAPSPQGDTPGPFHLRDLSFGSGYYECLPRSSSISGLFRILSLFTVDRLHGESRGCHLDLAAPLDQSYLHRPLRVKDLRLGCDGSANSKHALVVLNSFTEAIESGSLDRVEIECRAVSEVSATRQLLARTGESLTGLQVGAPGNVCLPKGWKDPMIRHWQDLNLASCPKLERIWINIYLPDKIDENQPTDVQALSLPGAGMLSQVSRALREIYIYVYDLPRVTTLNNRRLLRLQEFDKVITPDRFPLLRKVYLRIRPDQDLQQKPDYKWRQVVVGTRNALPNIHSRGMLRVQRF